MEKFRQKSELGFFFLWLWMYLLAQSGGELLSCAVGVRYAGTALLNALLAAYLWTWVKGQGLADYYGLCPVKLPRKDLLWFLPLVLISTHNLWNGAALNLPLTETVFCVLTMACVGFLEELLMRGFLFQGLKQRSVKTAVVVSTLLFGGAHTLNLRELGPVENFMQVAGALCFGLLCAVLLLRGGSLRPCIFAHCTINVLSVFAAAEPGRMILLSGVQMVLMLAYTAYLVVTYHLK